MRILVVEDDEGQARLLSSVLAESQPVFQPVVASRLDEACRQLAHRSFDAVLLDLNLPDSRALATFDRVRECSSLPVVVFTGESHLGDEALLRGADDYLVKGEANPRAVRRALSHAIQRRRLGAAKETIDHQLILLDSARDAIMVCAHDGEIQFWNAGATRLYGWTASEATGRNVLDLLGPESTPLDFIRAQTAEKGEWSGELRHLTRGGGEINVESRWSSVKRGEPSLLVINTDVTERRHLEAQLLRAQRYETLGTLAGGLAHDLNDILQPISLGTDLLRQCVTDPDLLPTIERVQSSAQRATELMGQLAAFASSRVDERKLVDTATIVSDIERLAHQMFPPTIEIIPSIADDLWPAWCNPRQAHQVLLTLVISARHAVGDRGSIVIGCENAEVDETFAGMSADAKPGSYAVFRVEHARDGTGGSAPARIFQPFYTRPELEPKTALSLASTSSIAQDQGGFIRVESEPQQATTFYFYLPAAGNVSSIHQADPSSVRPGRGELLLVIDDDESVREIMRAALEVHGFRVLSAADGAEGVAVFAREQAAIRAVISDVVMPVMDGLATVRAIRWLDPRARVIVMSGLTTPLSGELAEIATAIITKPFTATQLLAAVGDAVASEHDSRQQL